MIKHYSDGEGLRLLSYNAIFNFVQTNRNYGKTWTFKKRAFRRAMKHGKKTIWLRMFKEETKEAANTFFQSSDLRKYCGIELYDAETGKGNVKQEGKTFYYRRNEKSPWKWFIKIFTLSNPDAVRSADDVDVDTIVFDEYTKTQEKYRRYRGSIPNNFIDILFSAKREHEIKCVFLGNKEGFSNPFFLYFGITPPPSSWEGIKTYREGSIAIQQINNAAASEGDYNGKMAAALKGTSYGNYIYKSDYKAASGLKPRKMPATASLYVQLNIKRQSLKIAFLDGFYYVNRRIDESKPVYCDVLPHCYKKERLLVKRQRTFFYAFIDALARNAVFYDDELTHEAMQPFLQWLSV